MLGPPMALMLPNLDLPEVAGALDFAHAPVAPAAAALFDLAVVALRHAPLVVLVVLHLSSVGVAADPADDMPTPAQTQRADDEHCSKALGFNESAVPMDRSAQDLHFCSEHHKRTCCEKNRTQKLLGTFASFSHERSSRCIQMTRLALCSICDGDVGIGTKAERNSPNLCPSFCKQWFLSCYEDFFAPTGSGDLQPCGPSSLVCSPLNEITESSVEFCARVGGFSVASSEDSALDDTCYDGIPSARTRGKGPRAAWTPPVTRFSRDAYPWWHPRRWVLYLQTMQIRLPRSIEQNAPALIVASVAVFFASYVILRRDD